MKENVILDKSISFALEIVEYCELLEANKKYVIARQLLKSGTSIGANVAEAQTPFSKKDFIYKMSIVQKEAVESSYWLTICQKSTSYPNPENLKNQLVEIQ